MKKQPTINPARQEKVPSTTSRNRVRTRLRAGEDNFYNAWPTKHVMPS
jgi:hypothetical protein